MRAVAEAGGGGICRPGRSAVFKTTTPPQSPNDNKGSNDSQNCLLFCLLSLTRIMPDLVPVVKAWPKLSEHLKAGILAIVGVTVTGDKREGDDDEDAVVNCQSRLVH